MSATSTTDDEHIDSANLPEMAGLKNALKQKDHELAELQLRMLAQEKHHHQLEEESKALADRKNQLDIEVRDLLQQLDAARHDQTLYASMQQAISRLEEELKDVRVQQEQQREGLALKDDALKNALDEKEQLLAKSKETIKMLEEKLAQAVSAMAEAENRARDADARREVADLEVLRVQEIVAKTEKEVTAAKEMASTAERKTDLSAAHDTSTATSSALVRIDELEQKVAELYSENEALHRQLDSAHQEHTAIIVNREEQFQQVLKEKQTLMDQRKELDNEVRRLEHALKTARGESSELAEKLQEENAHLFKTESLLKEQVAGLQNKLSDRDFSLENMKTKLATVEDQLKIQEGNNKALQDDLETLRLEHTRSQQRESELSNALAEKQVILQDALTVHEKEATDHAAETDKLSAQVRRGEAEIKSLQEILENSKGAVDDAVCKLQLQYETLAAEKQKMQEQLDEMMAEKKRMKEENTAEIKQLREQLSSAVEEKKNLKEEATAASNAFTADKKSREEKYARDLQDALTKLGTSEADKSTIQQRCDVLSSELAISVQKLQEVEAHCTVQLSAAQSRLEHSEKEWQKKLEQLTKQLKDLEVKDGEASVASCSFQHTIDSLQQEITTLRQQNEKMHESLAAKEKLLNESETVRERLVKQSNQFELEAQRAQTITANLSSEHQAKIDALVIELKELNQNKHTLLNDLEAANTATAVALSQEKALTEQVEGLKKQLLALSLAATAAPNPTNNETARFSSTQNVTIDHQCSSSTPCPCRAERDVALGKVEVQQIKINRLELEVRKKELIIVNTGSMHLYQSVCFVAVYISLNIMYSFIVISDCQIIS